MFLQPRTDIARKRALFRFCYLLMCNCVLSEKALRQVRGSRCPSCSKEYSKENDVIILNGSEVSLFAVLRLRSDQCSL